MNLRNITIKTRLAALVVSGLVLLTIAAAGGLTGLRMASANAQRLIDMQRDVSRGIDHLGDRIANLRRYEKDVLLNLDKADKLAASLAQWNETHTQLLADAKTLDSRVADEGKAMLKEFVQLEGAYVAAAAPVMEKAKGGALDNARAGVAALAPAAEHIRAAEQILDRGEQRINALLEEARQKGETFNNRIQLAMLSLLAAALCVGSLIGWLVVRSIVAPLQSGVVFAKHMAEGDLSATPDASGRDEVTALMQALAEMAGALGSVVSQVRQASDSIQIASAEVASGNADLSHRTEQTASQLQNTSSSMSQLTSTVRQSADAAQQANQLAASAAEVAQRGGSVVNEVVTTMDRINTSSRKISDIIGTIDGIAFQTNILALNAAVEAARAGEQGRGFAVVAGEVRSLAQRSAEAAREIKSLISASVENVENGARLVGDAGATMSEIVASVQRVSDIIGEISAAASEQSGGIGQVNQTVTQLDQMTQQNAALVEESAAAAESLRDQAVRLAGTVQRFRVDAAAPHANRTSAPASPPANAPASAAPVATAARASLKAPPTAGTRPAAAPKAVAQQVIAKAAHPAPVKAARSAATPSAGPSAGPAAAMPAAAPATDDNGDWETF